MSHNYCLFQLKHLFCNELTFLVTYDVKMNVSSEAAIQKRCSSKEMFLKFSQYSQENACPGVSFGVRPEGLELY